MLASRPRGPVGEAAANVFRALGELTRAIGDLVSVTVGGPPAGPHLIGGKFMIIVKDTQPDVRYTVGGFKVVDAENHPVPGAVVAVTVESDNPAAVAVTPDADPASGSVSFGGPNDDGSPANATVLATVKIGDAVVGTFSETFTVTAGDPTAIQGGAITFEGLTPNVATPPSTPTVVTQPTP